MKSDGLGIGIAQLDRHPHVIEIVVINIDILGTLDAIIKMDSLGAIAEYIAPYLESAEHGSLIWKARDTVCLIIFEDIVAQNKTTSRRNAGIE